MDPLYRAPYEEICKLATYEKNNQKFWNFDSYYSLFDRVGNKIE